jgi:transcriptional regulator
MYIPSHFEERDVSVLHALIRSHPLGTWVVYSEGRLNVNHLPFVLDAAAGPFGALRGHVSRANNVWKAAAEPAPSVVVRIIHEPRQNRARKSPISRQR